MKYLGENTTSISSSNVWFNILVHTVITKFIKCFQVTCKLYYSECFMFVTVLCVPT